MEEIDQKENTDIEALVHKEIEEHRKKLPPEYQDMFYNTYFNNFRCNLPGGINRNLKNIPLNEPSSLKGKTRQEFFDGIDKTMAELNITTDQIKSELQEGKYDLMTQLMIHLRRNGYTYQSLVR